MASTLLLVVAVVVVLVVERGGMQRVVTVKVELRERWLERRLGRNRGRSEAQLQTHTRLLPG